MTDRRTFLQRASMIAAGAALEGRRCFARSGTESEAQLRIEPCRLEIGPGVSIDTVAYNGQVPGPLLRLKKGKPIRIAVTNASRSDDLVHWHGLTTDPINDGSVEEGSPVIKPGETLRYELTPEVSGTRWYHTHAMAMHDLSLATYTGQFGFLLVDGGPDPGHYDREVNLAIHHWSPYFVPMIETMRQHSQNVPQTSGSDVGYKYATMNAHMLGAGEPIRVKRGERVLFRLLNASATENVVLALPGHRFRVIAMDGNPVPNPQTVEVISLAVAERIDAIVEMDTPGVWVLGSTLKEARDMGLGVVVEYAGQKGAAAWKDPSTIEWDYSRFASRTMAPEPDETFTMTIRDAGARKGEQFDVWTINGDAWPDVKPMMVQRGKRYRMLFRNASGDQHPMHLHRHSFEVTQIGEKRLSGLIKDCVNVMPLETVAVDFVANNPGDSLVHCHQQLHMDYGFMQMIKYAD